MLEGTKGVQFFLNKTQRNRNDNLYAIDQNICTVRRVHAKLIWIHVYALSHVTC